MTPHAQILRDLRAEGPIDMQTLVQRLSRRRDTDPVDAEEALRALVERGEIEIDPWCTLEDPLRWSVWLRDGRLVAGSQRIDAYPYPTVPCGCAGTPHVHEERARGERYFRICPGDGRLTRPAQDGTPVVAATPVPPGAGWMPMPGSQRGLQQRQRPDGRWETWGPNMGLQEPT